MSDIPKEELSALWKELHDKFSQPSEPLEQSEAGQDIISLMDQVAGQLSLELGIFERLVGARAYQTRIFAYVQEKKGKRFQWALSDVQPAPSDTFIGGPDHLRALMDEMQQKLLREAAADKEVRALGTAVALWVHPMPGLDQFFLLARHITGKEATFIVKDRQCVSMGLSKDTTQMTLEAFIRPGKQGKKKMESLLRAQLGLMHQDMREDMAAFVVKAQGQSLTDELWDEMLKTIYLREAHIKLMHELERAGSVHALRESQELLEATTRLVRDAIDSHKERLNKLEKNQENAQKRFKSDLAKFQTAAAAASAKTRQVQAENQSLRKQLQAASAGQSRQDTQNGVRLALDRFFSG